DVVGRLPLGGNRNQGPSEERGRCRSSDVDFATSGVLRSSTSSFPGRLPAVQTMVSLDGSDIHRRQHLDVHYHHVYQKLSRELPSLYRYISRQVFFSALYGKPSSRSFYQYEHRSWRLITCMWLHANDVHVVTNMLSLIIIGIRLEKEFGFLTGNSPSDLLASSLNSEDWALIPDI
ncbi:Peptidase S54, rhomboid domain, partial [Dillenia turbinata]